MPELHIGRRGWIGFGVGLALIVSVGLVTLVHSLNKRGEEIAMQRRQVEARRVALDTKGLSDAFRRTRLTLTAANGAKREILGTTATMIWFTLNEAATGRAVIVARSAQGDFFATSYLRAADGQVRPSGEIRTLTAAEVTTLLMQEAPGIDPQAVVSAVSAGARP